MLRSFEPRTVIRRAYETGRKAAADLRDTRTIAFDELLPKWNYRAVLSNCHSY